MPSPCPCSNHTQRPQVTAPFWAGSERGQHQDPPGHVGPSDHYSMVYPHVTRGKQVERRGKTHCRSLPEPPTQPQALPQSLARGAGTRGQGSGDLHPHPSAGLQGPPQPQPPLKPLLAGVGGWIQALCWRAPASSLPFPAPTSHTLPSPATDSNRQRPHPDEATASVYSKGRTSAQSLVLWLRQGQATPATTSPS